MIDRITYIVPALSSAIVIGSGPTVLRLNLSEYFRVCGGNGGHRIAVVSGLTVPVDVVLYDRTVPAVLERLDDKDRALIVGKHFVETLVRTMEPGIGGMRTPILLKRVFTNQDDVDVKRPGFSGGSYL